MKKPTFKENVDAFVTLTSKIIRIPKDIIEYIKLSHSVIQVTVGVKIKNTICGKWSLDDSKRIHFFVKTTFFLFFLYFIVNSPNFYTDH